LYIKCLEEAQLDIEIIGQINEQEETLISMFSNFSQDADTVINIEPEQLKNLQEFKLNITNAAKDQELKSKINGKNPDIL